MTKIDVFSGFLGAGKTTLIKKLIGEAFKGEKIVLIENEFGEIGIDGGFLKDAGIQINEMNSGCICCSLVGDFGKALEKVMTDLAPERILIEPSGVGKLSDVIKAVEGVDLLDAKLNSATAIVDAKKCKMYMKNFGEFFNDQIEHANCIVLSHTAGMTEEKLNEVVALIREHNNTAVVVTSDWNEITGESILRCMESKKHLQHEIDKLAEEFKNEHHHHHHDDDDDDHECCHHHHHDDDDDDDHECCHHHHHDDDDDDHECCHHHHHDDDDDDDHDHECCHHHHHDDDDDDDHECCHHHHHDDDDDHDCCCHDGEHHHHHHHADEVFTSWGLETNASFTREELENILTELQNEEKYGMVLRAKGIVASKGGAWLYFDYVPGEPDIREGTPDMIGRLCVIGSKINEHEISELFGA